MSSEILSPGTERSSIKPNLPGMNREGQEVKELKFKYSTDAYDSYIKEGFEPPESSRRPDKFELRFVTGVDITKGKIKVQITRMFRVQAIDYSTEKQELRDYLLYESIWFAKNWMDKELVSSSHIEGKYKQQTKRLVTSAPDPNTGVLETWYEKGQPREVHTIPFNKREVDKVLFGEHPFGLDSINITDPSKVIFVGKLDHVLGVQSFRCGDFTYEQFIEPEWKTFVQLAIRPGGPAKRVPTWMATPDEYFGPIK